MKIEKRILDDIPRCYCTGTLTLDGALYLVLAGEAPGGPGYAYAADNEKAPKEILWEQGGGTMSLIQIPGTNGEFLAVQNFFPGFQAENAKVVWGKRQPDGGWQITDFIALPYIHRFDIFSIGGENYFLGCTLCGSKREREDWSDPGKVLIGKLPAQPADGMNLSPILEGLTKNHGYSRGWWEGMEAGYIACDSGVYAVIPPGFTGEEWQTRQITNTPTSDLTMWDVDGDGVAELITIEPFHGSSIKVYKKTGDSYTHVYEYPSEIEFAHVLAGCTLRGKPYVVCGVRRKDAELSLLSCTDPAAESYKVEIIEKGIGPSNVTVVNQPHRDLILSANHTLNQGVVYIFTD